MPRSKKRFSLSPILQKPYLQAAGILLLLLLAFGLLRFYTANSNQAGGTVALRVYFAGEYRVGDGEWQPIEAGKHIPATRGDVTLRGNFRLRFPNGEEAGLFTGSEPIAFYTDHIHLTFREEGRAPHAADHEHPAIGFSACGENYAFHSFQKGNEAPIEITVHNPHAFGNEDAIDEMLSRVAIGGNMMFEKTRKTIGKCIYRRTFYNLKNVYITTYKHT